MGKRLINFEGFVTYNADYQRVLHLRIRIGVMTVSVEVPERLRLKIVEFFAAPEAKKRVDLPIGEDDVFCPTIRVGNEYIDTSENTADVFGVRKVDILP